MNQTTGTSGNSVLETKWELKGTNCPAVHAVSHIKPERLQTRTSTKECRVPKPWRNGLSAVLRRLSCPAACQLARAHHAELGAPLDAILPRALPVRLARRCLLFRLGDDLLTRLAISREAACPLVSRRRNANNGVAACGRTDWVGPCFVGRRTVVCRTVLWQGVRVLVLRLVVDWQGGFAAGPEVGFCFWIVEAPDLDVWRQEQAVFGGRVRAVVAAVFVFGVMLSPSTGTLLARGP